MFKNQKFPHKYLEVLILWSLGIFGGIGPLEEIPGIICVPCGGAHSFLFMIVPLHDQLTAWLAFQDILIIVGREFSSIHETVTEHLLVPVTGAGDR
jgi:hypothetical protein